MKHKRFYIKEFVCQQVYTCSKSVPGTEKMGARPTTTTLLPNWAKIYSLKVSNKEIRTSTKTPFLRLYSWFWGEMY